MDDTASPPGQGGATSPGGMDRTRRLRSALLRWYERSARDLPWRRTRDPYAIWVAEVMLQQTRVEQALPYYARFMQRFPSVETLAAASEDDVLALWSGLGYYRRARQLHAGVREVAERYGGRVPHEPAARRALPGVGRYTAGAIGSIAFGRAEAIVDGNVARVLSRLFAVDLPSGTAASQRRLWSLSETLVRGPRPGTLNQALMELGATLCTRSKPRCEQCPVVLHCEAYSSQRVGELPVARRRAAPRALDWCAVAAFAAQHSQPALWLARAPSSLFGGLWNLPTVEGHGRANARQALEALGIRAKLDGAPAGRVKHVLSHRRLEVELWLAEQGRGTGSETLRAVPVHTLQRVGTSRLTRKLVALAMRLAGSVPLPRVAGGVPAHRDPDSPTACTTAKTCLR
ncbi:MAG: A/G-specific adenine glycosylase [Proteobacteria bacterium]|nr:A/G-specific adenine glycosylase [Pseudomonadota bacterium]